MEKRGLGSIAEVRNPKTRGAAGDPLSFNFIIGGKFISAGKGMHEVRTQSETELVIVSSGTLGIRVGNRAYDVGAGQFLVMPAWVEHGGTRPYPRDLSFYWLHMRPDAGREGRLPQYGAVARPAMAYFWSDALLAEQRIPDNGDVCDRILGLVFCEVVRKAAPVAAIAGSNGEILASAARRRLRLDFRSPGCSTSAVAKALRCNPDYLGRVYRAMFGETIMDTIDAMRLSHCEALLRKTTLGIAEIARDAGYSDPAYFRRRFAMRRSMTPKAWRMAHTSVASHVNSV